VLTTMSHSDPARTIASIEPLLSSAQTSTRVKERALFVLSQMDDPKAREILANVAKNPANADLQSRAVKYIGIAGGDKNRQLLAEVYGTASDPAVKRAVLRSFMLAHDDQRLLNVAKTEASPDLRHEAIQQLGVLGARTELNQLYKTETVVDLKKQILQAMFVGGDVNDLLELAKGEKDPQLRRVAVRNLGLIGAPATGDALLSIFNSDQDPEIRKAVVDALFIQNNAHTLVALARAEKNPEMKKAIVSKLALMHSKEAADYLAELLK
jgi:HEAT repeat protein